MLALLVLSSFFPGSGALGERTGGPPSIPGHETAWSAAAPASTASNDFVWDGASAASTGVVLQETGGIGLQGMASNGTTALLFGSFYDGGTSYLTYTVLYNETTNAWTTVSGSMPPPLGNFSLTSDPAFRGGSAVLFGGSNLTFPAAPTPSNATWVFSFRTEAWSKLTTVNAPSARDDVALATDPVSGDVVAVGGWNDTSGTPDHDVWVLNVSTVPATWTNPGSAPQIVPSHPGVFGAGLVATAPGRFLMADGCTDTPTLVCANATYSLHVTPASVSSSANVTKGPSARGFASFAWDPAQRVALLYGGATVVSGTPTLLRDTWEYFPSTNQWTSTSNPATNPSPGNRYLAPCAWINASGNETLLLTGGQLALRYVPDPALWRLSPSVDIEVGITLSDGAPAYPGNATVWVDNYRWNTSTDINGTGLFTVGSGATRVGGNASHYYNTTTSLATIPGESTKVDLVLEPLPVLAVRTWSNATGTPVPLGGVALTWNRSVSSLGDTNAKGWGNETALHGGSVQVNASAFGFVSASGTANIGYLGVTFLNITLRSAPPANLSVQVWNRAGKPVAGAVVAPTNYSGVTATTDAKGFANFSGLDPGNILAGVLTTHPADYPNDTSVYLPPNRTTHLNVTLTSLPVLTVRAWANVSGKIVPLPLVDLYWNSTPGGTPTGVTATGGWWNHTMPHGGGAYFYGTRAGYGRAFNYTNLPYTGHAFLNLTLVAILVTLIVHVTDRSTALGIAGATVEVTDSQGRVVNQTNATGTTLLPGVIPGNDSLATTAPTYYGNLTNLTVSDGSPSWFNVSLVPWPSLHVDVRSAIINGTGGAGLGAAQVFRNVSLIGFTGATGWFNATRVPPGAANVSGQEPGYHPSWQNVVLNHTGALNVTLTLWPVNGTLRVHVLGAGRSSTTGGTVPQPLFLAEVNVTSQETGTKYFGYTSATGWANLTLPEGNYTFDAWIYAYYPLATQGPYSVGDPTVNVTLLPLPGANVSVLVLDRNTSAPIGGAQVVFQYGALPTNESTDSQGWAPFTDLWPAGYWTVTGAAPGYETNTTPIALGFRETLPRYVVLLTPISQSAVHNTTTNTSAPFSLVPPQEHNLWWPFLILPLLFMAGAAAVVLSQRSRRSEPSDEA